MKLKHIIDGVVQIDFEDFDITQLDNADQHKSPLVDAAITYFASQLGFKLLEISIWNKFPIGSNPNEIPFSWHHDHNLKCDTLMLIYFTDEELTEETGGRIGFSNLEQNNKKYYNIKSGLCFLVNQHTTLHSVEVIKKQLTKRLCLSCSLQGWDDFINANKIN